MTTDKNNAAPDPQPAELAEQQGVALLPCPFCGESAERIDFGPGAGDNEGGSCVACTGCGSSGPVEFGFKENFRSTWNRRALAATGKQQVGEVQGDALTMIGSNLRSILDLSSKMGGGSYQITVANIQHETNHALQLLEAALAARQPGAQETVDVEAALAAGDPNWQAQCRPNLRGNERLFFAVRDIAEMRAMLAGEKNPLPGSGLAVVRVNPNAPSVVPYQCAHRLLGDAYQAGEKGGGFCDQAEELFVAMTAHAKRNRLAVVYAAPPAQGIDLGQQRPLIARSLAEWHEDDGNVMWWAWCGRDWAGEPAWCGTPNDSDWPGYHTHWTQHPSQPALIDQRDAAPGVGE